MSNTEVWGKWKLIWLNCMEFFHWRILAQTLLYVTKHCIFLFSFLNQPEDVITAACVSTSKWILHFLFFVWSYTRGNKLGSADTSSPEGTYCLSCAQHVRAEDLSCWHYCKVERSSSRLILFTPKCTGKYCLAVADVSEEGRFTRKKKSACTFFKHVLYICIYLLCFYYKIACIKLLDSVASFIGARVKAVSVKKINYLYRYGIEASSKL